MEMIWPLLAPAAVWRRRLPAADSLQTPLPPHREWMRFTLRGDVRISIPVAGGASALKRHTPGSWILSPHGRWNAILAGALDALYGRTPYYPHLAPCLMTVVNDCYNRAAQGQQVRAAELAVRTDRLCLRFMGLESSEETPAGILSAMQALEARSPGLPGRLQQELAPAFDPDESIIGLLMHLGPQAIFALCGAFE